MTELEMTGLLLKLADLSVTGIKVKYDGGGDSGAIEWIGYTKEFCGTPEDVYDGIDAWNNDINLMDLDSRAYSLIEDFAQERILNDLEDWWNNEGGYGTVLITIPSGNYTINNSIYISDTEEFIHHGNLINKSLN